ncbi:facilitated trehalose transporter Tret1-like [Leguminivora glycinivorella]|uniref:facilitated trehalose transporter Tret1-like n=1 Tax=Leguminivora glycinivorella TaxID=1035111 RepID=UPI00200EABB6|nr:facilitated trehalose transporter Tret1-like [Leguminivora glycinivorella]
MSFFRQLLCTVLVSYSCLSLGVTMTWPSSTLLLFRSENTPLHRPMTETEQALFGSLSSIGALLATPVAGYLSDVKGRKFTVALLSLMHVICWSMIIVSNRVEVVLTALFVSGIGSGTFFVTPVYISDFCQESVRGQLTSGAVIFYTIGVIVSYIVGGFLDYQMNVYACLGISVLGVVLLSLIKESPLFLMIKEREQEAKESIAFFRNVKIDSKEVLHEIATIRRGLNPEMDDTGTPEEECKLKPIAERKKLSPFQFIRKSYSTRRALATAVILLTLSIFQGLIAVQVYAEPLFGEAVPSMSPAVSSILFSVVMFVVGLVAAYLTDVVGRKPLMVYSSLVSAACCLLLGSQIHFRWAPHSATAVFIYMFCVVYTLGAGTIPYVTSPELFLPEIKSFATMLVTEWIWLCTFVILFAFQPAVGLVGLGPVFYAFAAVGLATAAFAHGCMPETKGLPVDEIQALFSKKRATPSYA